MVTEDRYGQQFSFAEIAIFMAAGSHNYFLANGDHDYHICSTMNGCKVRGGRVDSAEKWTRPESGL
jgi:hypothetical protein